jgi:exodeoxyribonuclease-3
VKIATYNINDVRKRLGNLLEWLEVSEPDVVCLQELKATDAQFPADVFQAFGYESVWVGQPTWNGVAILARGVEPLLVRTRLPGDAGDDQARYVEAAVNGVLVASLYLPNGNPAPGPKFDYKMRWFERLLAHAAELVRVGAPAVLAGDYNVVPTDSDIYSIRSWSKNALLRPEPRQAYSRLLAQGWTDALARPEGGPFTFWQYLRNAWERDAGLRLDHLLVSPPLSDRIMDRGVDRWTRGEEDASDHAPAWIVLDPPRAGEHQTQR